MPSESDEVEYCACETPVDTAVTATVATLDPSMLKVTVPVGEPVPPGPLRRQATGNRAGFQKSFLAARRYREEAEPKRMMETLEASFAGKQVQEDLAGRIAKMDAVVAALPMAAHGQRPR